jgi:hypothetical protein
MKTTTVTGSRFFLLTLAIGNAAITPTFLAAPTLPNVPPSAVAPPPKLVISDPTKGLRPYVPSAPPAPLSTITLLRWMQFNYIGAVVDTPPEGRGVFHILTDEN